jgi:dephospho-CoA kinase
MKQKMKQRMKQRMKQKFILGLTGGIGSGKTTVANLFAALGIDIVDADIVAREVVAIGSLGLNAIVEHFGQSILLANGELDRAALRQEIFDNPEQRLWLNKLLHPLIRQKMFTDLEKTTSAYAVLVAPLLFENELDRQVSKSLVVDIAPELQLLRTSVRDNLDTAQIAKIVASQMSREKRLSKADYIIENNSDLVHLHQEVDRLHQAILVQCN